MVLERRSTQPLFIFKQHSMPSPVPRFGPSRACMLIAQPDREALSGCLTAGSSLKVCVFRSAEPRSWFGLVRWWRGGINSRWDRYEFGATVGG